MEDYEAKRFIGKAENITVGEMLDLWIEEGLKPSSLSNGTVMAYTASESNTYYIIARSYSRSSFTANQETFGAGTQKQRPLH